MLKEDGWHAQWNKHTVHYFHDGYPLCNNKNAVSKNRLILVGNDYSLRFCKSCLITLNTYNDLNNSRVVCNRFPQPNPHYVGAKS